MTEITTAGSDIPVVKLPDGEHRLAVPSEIAAAQPDAEQAQETARVEATAAEQEPPVPQATPLADEAGFSLPADPAFDLSTTDGIAAYYRHVHKPAPAPVYP